MDLEPNALAQILTSIADLISALIWPILVIFGLIFFRKPIFNFLGSAKQISLNFLGHKITIEGDTVAPDIKELLLDIQDTVSGLTEQHRLLQELRDRKLIRPFEGGSWRAEKHPIITRFSRLILRINPSFLEP